MAAHPFESVPADATFPKAGRYRLWTQFKRGGVVWTVPFTVDVFPVQ